MARPGVRSDHSVELGEQLEPLDRVHAVFLEAADLRGVRVMQLLGVGACPMLDEDETSRILQTHK